ncbi:MAG: radical SAM protein [Victivallaceae bacterium]
MSEWPFIAELYLTEQCNLNCRYCYVDHKSPNVGLSSTEWIAVLDELAAMRVCSVLFSGGEPLLRKDFVTLLQAAVERRMRFSLTTNGTLLTADLLEHLLPFKQRCDNIQISVDGPEYIHDLARGRGAFAAMVHGVRLLRQADFPLTARITLGRHNIGHIAETAKVIFDDLQIPYCGINLVTKIHGQEVGLEPALDDFRSVLCELPEVFKRWPNRFLADGPWMAILSWKKFLNSPLESSVVSPCHLSGRRLCVMSNGDVVHCSVLQDLPGGNCREKSLRDIWAGMSLKSIGVAAECLVCEFKGRCPGRCNCSEGMCLERFLKMGGSVDELLQ